MADEDRIDVIIVGAGPAGLACAYKLALAGKSVVVLERGASVGEKNLTGGRLYVHALESLGKDLPREAAEAGALERPVTHEQIMFMTNKSATLVDFCDQKFLPSAGEANPGSGQSWTVLHSRFTAWLGEKAEEAGAMIGCGVLVDKLLAKNGVVVGALAGEDELYADTVVLADGVNSLLAASMCLDPAVSDHSVGVGIKEVVALPANVINERFQVGEHGGAARVILGCTEGIPGGGALYTNRESVSLACVFNPAKAAMRTNPLPEIFQRFREHAAIASLLQGGETIEYGAHLVMENGWRNVMRHPWKKGLLVTGEAAGYVINTGLIIRGIDLALLSGSACAQAILEEADPDKLGEVYEKELEKSGLIKAMRFAAKWPDLMASPQLYASYPALVNDMLAQMFSVNDEADPLRKRLFKSFKTSGAGVMPMLRDMWKAWRAL